MKRKKKKKKLTIFIIIIELGLISYLSYNLITKYNLHKVDKKDNINVNNINKNDNKQNDKIDNINNKDNNKNGNKENNKKNETNNEQENVNINQQNVNNNVNSVDLDNSYLNKVTYNNLKIDNEVHELIVKYMDLYYKSMEDLVYYDIKNLFSDNKEAYKNETAISYLVEARKLRNFDMKLSNVKYDLDYTAYSVKDNIYKVELKENGYYNCNFIKNITSKVYGVKNTFEIIKVDNNYKIKSFNKVQDFYVMINKSFKNTSDYKNELDKIKSNFLNQVKEEQNKLNNDYNNLSNYKITKKYDHEYDRGKAVNYVKQYVTTRNNKWYKYDDIGGNCQNYASQMLYEGGIPMDTKGDISVQWKHYSSSVVESSEAKGRSYSWTGVPHFYKYAKNNTGFGLVAEVDANYYSGEKGDVAQVGYNGDYTHTAVIIDTIKDENGKIIDLLLNSNTVNMENYPLQGYVYPLKRIIKILGYND